MIERAAILARDGRVMFDLPPAGMQAISTAQSIPAASYDILSEADRRKRDRSNIEAALRASGGKVFGRGGAAELLGIKPTTLTSRMKTLGMKKA